MQQYVGLAKVRKSEREKHLIRKKKIAKIYYLRYSQKKPTFQTKKNYIYILLILRMFVFLLHLHNKVMS